MEKDLWSPCLKQKYSSIVRVDDIKYISGLAIGDEILVLNGRVVSELDMVYVEQQLSDAQAAVLTVRSCRFYRPCATTAQMEHADTYIDHMVCPPPPMQSRISDQILDELIVPAPNWGELSASWFF